MVGLEVKKSHGKGLGVFATRRFEKGELVECCRVLVVPRTDVSIGYSTSLMRHYVVEWGEKLAVPTGYGCFYNHSYQPNAIHAKHMDLCEIHFLALCDILPYEEITFNYGGYPSCKDALWFEVK